MLTQDVSPNPLLTIWVRPRTTFRHILEETPPYLVLVLAALAGVAEVLDNAVSRNAGDHVAIPIVMLFCLLVGPVFGVGILYIFCAALYWIGMWFGGTGSGEDVRAAFAWAAVPTIVGLLLLWPLMLLVLGPDALLTSTALASSTPLQSFAGLGFGLALFILSIWNMVLSVACLAEAHQFSLLRALGTWITLFIAFVVVIGLGVVGVALLVQ